MFNIQTFRLPTGLPSLAMAGLLGLLLVAPACLADPSSDESTCQGHECGGSDSADPTVTRAELRVALRELWEEHVQWTRQVIVSFAGELPDFDAAVSRLLLNQEDIGNAIKPFYGDQAGDELTALLTEHILVAAEVLQAAQSGDQPGLDDAIADWYANGDEIADFLTAANPQHWPSDAMRSAMREHLDTTLAEASARLTGDWEQDVAAYDLARKHVLMMADVLADGIAAQFPVLVQQ